MFNSFIKKYEEELKSNRRRFWKDYKPYERLIMGVLFVLLLSIIAFGVLNVFFPRRIFVILLFVMGLVTILFLIIEGALLKRKWEKDGEYEKAQSRRMDALSAVYLANYSHFEVEKFISWIQIESEKQVKLGESKMEIVNSSRIFSIVSGFFTETTGVFFQIMAGVVEENVQQKISSLVTLLFSATLCVFLVAAGVFKIRQGLIEDKYRIYVNLCGDLPYYKMVYLDTLSIEKAENSDTLSLEKVENSSWVEIDGRKIPYAVEIVR